MTSVDLTAKQLMKRWQLPYERINIHRMRKRDLMRGFHIARNIDDFRNYTHILYWGDFQNNPMYGYSDFCTREVNWNYSPNTPVAKTLWRELFLSLPERLEGTVSTASVGNCFIGCSSFKNDKITRSAFESFCLHSKLILPREDYSRRELEYLGGSAKLPNCLSGLDCAFLYKPNLSHVTIKRPYFAYCFQRSQVSFSNTQRTALEKALDLPGRYTPWTEPGLWRVRGLKKALNIINGAELVITDIYHVCVNALNIGKPVVCLMRSTDSMDNTLSDRKKLALFEAVNGKKWLIKLGKNEELSDHIESIVQLANIARAENAGLKTVLEQVKIRRQRMLHSLQEFFGINSH
ncbi:MAG TPA: hypothetical protein ENJ28_08470 [Gammaproteobacteria bacterium]|nr:hypothetical protein [Gammaproteobacteria bacterium]